MVFWEWNEVRGEPQRVEDEFLNFKLWHGLKTPNDVDQIKLKREQRDKSAKLCILTMPSCCGKLRLSKRAPVKRPGGRLGEAYFTLGKTKIRLSGVISNRTSPINRTRNRQDQSL